LENQGVEVVNEVSAAVGSDWLARLIRTIGQAVSWLLPVLVIMIFVIVVLRYGFNLGWIWLQEMTVYIHSAVFMLAAAWALQTDGHVRVDIFYRQKSDRYRAWVNLLGTAVFLAPFCIFMLVIGWNYVAPSWQNLEGSREPGGLPLVYLLKTLILLLPATLLIQSVSSFSQHLKMVMTPVESG
jgi:TRAP-type mannitol/chloroaromatic compound transport system permease small subunit